MEAPRTYDEVAAELRVELKRVIGPERLRALHERSFVRHAAVAVRQVAVGALAVTAILCWPERAWVWVPASIAIGFVVFSFTVLLHEVVHRAVFEQPGSPWNRWLGHLYAAPSGLSQSQFTRWHLDHHQWLGTASRDPKRRELTPKIVKRWYKALYLTPALFPIYFRAARRAAAEYDPALRAAIARERRVAIALHLAVAASLWWRLGFALAAKLHLLPVFVVFPVVFTLNRLGQHYDVEPSIPARWGTLMRKSPYLWDWLYLWSNHHLEHHYFPGVPFYRLTALRAALDPWFREHAVPERGYAELLWSWLGRNRSPHTNWALEARAPGAGAPIPTFAASAPPRAVELR
ncbi:MAG: fatty acid desaturase [bacterium]